MAEEKIFKLDTQSKENMGEWIKGLNASGYAGIKSNGCIVDRREFPDATPIQENIMFGIIKPKKV